MSQTPGTRLGPYVIEARIGAGGMGEVYRARDPRLERSVAIKVLGPYRSGDHEFETRFGREMRALSTLSHPNVCAVHDAGIEGGTRYFVMELLEGETLAARLARGPLPLDQALDVGRQIARALAASHRAGLIHRDVKPSNVMLTPSGVKLLDFGLVRAAFGAGTAHDTVSDALTDRGAVLGTIQYMSPEQLTAALPVVASVTETTVRCPSGDRPG